MSGGGRWLWGPVLFWDASKDAGTWGPDRCGARQSWDLSSLTQRDTFEL